MIDYQSIVNKAKSLDTGFVVLPAGMHPFLIKKVTIKKDKNGGGKTTSIGSMDGPVLVVNQEGQLGSLYNQFKDSPDQLKRFTIANVSEVDDMYDTMMKLHESLSKKKKLPKWIVIDSLSGVAKKISRECSKR